MWLKTAHVHKPRILQHRSHNCHRSSTGAMIHLIIEWGLNRWMHGRMNGWMAGWMVYYMSNGRVLTDEFAKGRWVCRAGLPHDQWVRMVTMILCIDWFRLIEGLAHGRFRLGGGLILWRHADICIWYFAQFSRLKCNDFVFPTRHVVLRG